MPFHFTANMFCRNFQSHMKTYTKAHKQTHTFIPTIQPSQKRCVCFSNAHFVECFLFTLSIFAKIKMIFAILNMYYTHSLTHSFDECFAVFMVIPHFVAFYSCVYSTVCTHVSQIDKPLCYVLITHVQSIHYILKIKHNLLAIWNLYLCSHTRTHTHFHICITRYSLNCLLKPMSVQWCRCNTNSSNYGCICCVCMISLCFKDCFQSEIESKLSNTYTQHHTTDKIDRNRGQNVKLFFL